MLSLSLAHPSGCLSSQYSKIPISTTNSPSGFLRFSKIPYKGRRFHAKAARTEDDADAAQKPPISPSVGSPAADSFLSRLCPLLKFFAGGDPSQERNDFLEVATSSLSSLARLPWGSRPLTGTAHNLDSTTNPPKLQLYEFGECEKP